MRASRRSLTGTFSQWLLRGLPVAAVVALAVVVLETGRNPEPVVHPELATVTKIIGPATLAAAESSSTAITDAATVVRAGDTVRTGADGAVSLLLRSGLDLRIGSGSEVSLTSSSSVELRRGTLYLDSGPNPEEDDTLEIETLFGTVRHHGTQYEARVGSNNLRLRIREGQVGIRGAGGEAIGTAGEQLLITASAAAPLRSAISTTGPEWAWVERLAAVPSTGQYRVTDLLAWIARETGRQLDYANGAVATTAQSATLVGVAGLSPTETLEVIRSTTALRYELDGDALLIY